MQIDTRFHLLCTMLAATFLMATGCEVYNVYDPDDAPDISAELAQTPEPSEVAEPASAAPPADSTPPATSTPPAPAPTPPAPTTASLMQWIPDRGGRAVLRIRADLGPVGYGIITASGHKHIDPSDGTHDAWMSGNNNRPPHRIVDGWAEWTLPMNGATYAQRALAFGTSSGPVVMVFNKISTSAPGTGASDVSHFIDPRRAYGGPGQRLPTRNYTNGEWTQEL